MEHSELDNPKQVLQVRWHLQRESEESGIKPSGHDVRQFDGPYVDCKKKPSWQDKQDVSEEFKQVKHELLQFKHFPGPEMVLRYRPGIQIAQDEASEFKHSLQEISHFLHSFVEISE